MKDIGNLERQINLTFFMSALSLKTPLNQHFTFTLYDSYFFTCTIIFRASFDFYFETIGIRFQSLGYKTL